MIRRDNIPEKKHGSSNRLDHKVRQGKRKCNVFFPALFVISVGILRRLSYTSIDYDINIDPAPAAVHSASKEDSTPPNPKTSLRTISNQNRPASCSVEQLKRVMQQLPPEPCIETIRNPWNQKCSLTEATKCPDATWLDDYYRELQEKTTKGPLSPFLGISIGCNKGFDAINTLRMGTFDKSINKNDWKDALQQDGSELHQSVCNQDNTDLFDVLPSSRSQDGTMYCIEPMPETVQRLKIAANHLDYKGLEVVHAAISKENSEMFFPTDRIGIENVGIQSFCNGAGITEEERTKRCHRVPVYSLPTFMEKFVSSDLNNDVMPTINILSIDVEGYDGDVLLGATKSILNKVEYLEFEYNWMGSWGKQHLYDIVKMLDEVGMSCYFSGIDKLWRITDCWLPFYDLRYWSNVACVSRQLVPDLATKMEDTFQRTLRDDTLAYWPDTTAEYKSTLVEKYKDHELVSTKPEDLSRKYYS